MPYVLLNFRGQLCEAQRPIGCVGRQFCPYFDFNLLLLCAPESSPPRLFTHTTLSHSHRQSNPLLSMNIYTDQLNHPKQDEDYNPHEFPPHVNRGAPPLAPPLAPPFHPLDIADPHFEEVAYPPDLRHDVNEFGPFHVINNHAIINNHPIPVDIDMDDDASFQPVPSMFVWSDCSPIGIPASTLIIPVRLKTCLNQITHSLTMDTGGQLGSGV